MQKAASISLLCSSIISISLVSCGIGTNDIGLATGTVAQATSSKSAELYAEANKREADGDSKKAVSQYRALADKYPLAKEAPEARFRQAELLYAAGQLLSSFTAYQEFITSYRGTRLYDKAISRQAEVAHAAASGDIQHNFFGLKSNVAPSRAQKMLEQVRDNAPYGVTATRAQFAIGQMWEGRKNHLKAISAYQQVQLDYPKSHLAAEALYRSGVLLIKQHDQGNRNRANLETARSTFIDVRQLYPNTKQAKAAKVELKKLESSIISQNYDVAEFYLKKGQKTSAAYYYKEVIRETKPSSSLHQRAKQRLTEVSQ